MNSPKILKKSESKGPFSRILANILPVLKEFNQGIIQEKDLRKGILDSVMDGKKSVMLLLSSTMEETARISSNNQQITAILLKSAETIVKIAEKKVQRLEKQNNFRI